MKKIFCMFIVLNMIFLTACGSVSIPERQETTTVATTTDATVSDASPSDATVSDGDTVDVSEEAATVQQETPTESFDDKTESLSALSGDESITTEAYVKNEMMKKLMDELGAIVLICGFDYDEENDLFYSTKYPLQRFFGYNTLYDLAAPRVGLIYNTQKIYFTYNNMDYMIQLWKGQYGITVGAEVGVYYKERDQLLPHYNCVDDKDMIVMSFDLYKNGDLYFSRGPEKHWWLTGFKLLDVAVFLQLTMEITFYFDNREMANAFVEGLDKRLISDITYKQMGSIVTVDWTI